MTAFTSDALPEKPGVIRRATRIVRQMITAATNPCGPATAKHALFVSNRSRKEITSCTVLVAHPGAELYGSDRVLLESVVGMLAAGRRVVVALPADGPLATKMKEAGARVEICPMPVVRKSTLTPHGLALLLNDAFRGLGPMWRLIREPGTATVLVNTVTIPAWVVVGRLGGRRVICHVHEAERSASRVLRTALYAPLLLATGIVVNSRFSLQVLSETLPRLQARSTVVYNGVPGPSSESRPLRSAPGSNGQVRLLFCGRLSPRKGPQVAVDALDRLVRQSVDARLELLGAVYSGYEWFEHELRDQVIRLGLADRVSFHGFDPDIWPYLDEADICLVPSVIDEPFGNTAVEAILAGRPLVVSATSGLIEASAGYACARTVTPNDPAAVASAVRDLLEHWPRVRQQISADTALAMRRHAPTGYRQAMTKTVTP